MRTQGGEKVGDEFGGCANEQVVGASEDRWESADCVQFDHRLVSILVKCEGEGFVRLLADWFVVR